jgi:aminoglycoside/choline kinase family phosphotransferase
MLENGNLIDPRFKQMVTWTKEKTNACGVQFEAPCTGASGRRYFRAKLPNGKTVIVMDAPPDSFDCEPYIRAAGEMTRSLAADVLHFDADVGFMLLSDLGRFTLYDRLPAEPNLVKSMFESALDGIIKLQGIHIGDQLTAYSSEKMREEMNDFIINYVIGLKKQTLSESQNRSLATSLDRLVEICSSQHFVYSHFDYYSKNIIPTDSGVRLVDIQDACCAPSTYDVVSLLRDVNVALPKPMHDSLLDYYIERNTARSSNFDPAQFRISYYAMSLHRHLRIMSTFALLSKNAGRHHYLLTFPLIIKYIREECFLLQDFFDVAQVATLHVDAVREATPAHWRDDLESANHKIGNAKSLQWSC